MSKYGTPIFWRGPYAMRIVSSEEQVTDDEIPLGRNQWLYTLKPVDWGTDYLYVGNLDTAQEWDKAINLWEINNTNLTAMGLGTGVGSLRPAPNGAIVFAYTIPATADQNDISPLVAFQYPNQWECSSELIGGGG